ncbi:hypothetical protein DFH08DRAFT_29640 [Mycena albidolilacea]|uniref:Phosphatidate phosphatase APP1 catalytic domain-containing protein n=1 Tax=Mycena albidolilacea TaxID=1033008 RepID=A0AAD7AV30_9AGAR|nr:hypothetical protein DFH08DRAFT_29640 [Mycena albidolilacea]
MRSALSFFTFGLAAVELTNALPRAYQAPSRRSSVNILDDVLVFDAPAFDDPANPGNTLVQLQAYVSSRELSLEPLLSGISGLLNKTLGLDISNSTDRAAERLALFGTIPLSNKDVTVNVNGCGDAASLPPTDSGMAIQNLTIGACNGTVSTLGTVKLTGIDSRNTNFTVFPSSADGFGVISDIDDTVKVSHSLDKLLLAKATLVDDPVPVTGMPDVFKSLAASLNSPQFIYVSASPFQLYPFLRDFIDTTYAASSGPIFLNNLTTTSLTSIIDFAKNDGIFEYKSAMIDRIAGMYPGKKFLTVGDSTQKDPETYGEAIRKYGDFIACAWIRKVDGANNTDARFAAAFAGVDPSKFKLYTDDEIPGLADVDVAGGKCS